MQPERWRRLQELFDAALERLPDERAAFLHAACGDDASMRAEVASLLRASGRADETLQDAIARVADEVAPPGGGVAPSGGELRPGDHLGAYQVVREIGRGGMGAVYLAVRADDVWRKQVAIKIVRGGQGSPALRDRFLHERRILARLDHPYIARVLDGGETPDGQPWLAMEFVEGQPLDRYCASQALTLSEKLQLFERVCEAVHYAHRNLVIHRDLKPSNVLVQDDGAPRLLDFGIARLLDPDTAEGAPLTVPGVSPMTPPYASPEQVRGEPVTTASDVCSLGVMLYELLAGCLPYRVEGGSRRAVERAILEEDPPAPSVAVAQDPTLEPARRRRQARELAGDLDAIVLKALRKEPDARYGSAASLAEDLRRYREGLPVEARRGTWRYRTARFVRRHRAGVAAAAAVALVLAASAVALAVQASRLAVQRDRASEEARTSREVADFMASIFEVANPDQGKPTEITARELLDRGAQRLREQLHDQPLVRARMLATIGTAYRSLGLYDSAAARIDEALAIRERESGSHHPDYATILNQRGMLYLDRGRLHEARGDYERAAGIREAVLGPQHPDLAMSLLDLGIVQSRLGAPDSALVLLERSRAILEQAHGPAHRDVALALNSLALVHAQEGRFAVADSLLQRVLSIRQREFGPGHPRVGELLNNLGTLAARRGENVVAQGHLEQAYEVFERAMGPEHPQTLSAMANLAAVVRRNGDLQRARSLQERCLELETLALGPDHSNVAGSCINLSRTLVDLGERQRAFELLERAHGVLTRAHGPATAGVARVEVDLAEMLLQRGERSRARGLALQARGTLSTLGRQADPAFERAGRLLEPEGENR